MSRSTQSLAILPILHIGDIRYLEQPLASAVIVFARVFQPGVMQPSEELLRKFAQSEGLVRRGSVPSTIGELNVELHRIRYAPAIR